VSAGYTDELPNVMLPFARHALALAELAPGAELLDVATGPGTLALEAAPHVKRVDAVDFSPAMLEQLERRRRELRIENVHPHRADGQALPFREQSFDAAFSMFGLMFFPERDKGFSELHRTLRPGGLAVVSSWAPVAESPLMLAMFGALRAADPSRPAPQTNPFSLENPDLFSQELRAAGFRDVRIERRTVSVEISDPASWWDLLARASAPLVLLQKRLGPEEWQRQSAVAKAWLAREIPTSRSLTTTAFLGFGRR
jgi:ubiquinone/menaquinone biosynthesis C-methylase UbiE